VQHFASMTYTITPVPDGNVRAELIDEEAFLAE